MKHVWLIIGYLVLATSFALLCGGAGLIFYVGNIVLQIVGFIIGVASSIAAIDWFLDKRRDK